MENARIACAKPVYKPLHHYLGSKACPHTDLAFQKTLSIPIYPTLSDSDIERVVAAVSKTYKNITNEKKSKIDLLRGS